MISTACRKSFLLFIKHKSICKNYTYWEHEEWEGMRLHMAYILIVLNIYIYIPL